MFFLFVEMTVGSIGVSVQNERGSPDEGRSSTLNNTLRRTWAKLCLPIGSVVLMATRQRNAVLVLNPGIFALVNELENTSLKEPNEAFYIYYIIP